MAQVLVSKYADHLPLYRQAQIYARQGIDLDRSTLADWVGRAAFLLRPVHERLLAALKASTKLFADETTAPVLDPGRGRTKTGQLWAYARDDRPWGGTDPPGVAYVYAPDRKAERPIAHLAGFKGILQVDGYGGYRALAERGDVQLAFCWSHVRRRFYELAAAGPAPIASEALERIAGLYAIENEIRGRSADERRAVRQERSRPIIDDLEPWLRAKLALISQKTKLAEAIRYALSRWDGLTRFLDDGRIEIDSNVVERSIRPIALNRKNALFAGSDGGGEHWAVIASLIETCKLNGVDPHAYLADVITKIVNGHPNSRIDDLLPWAYPAAQLTQGRGLKTPLTLQPALDVEQHPRAVRMTTDRLEHQLPIDAVEIGFYVEIEHPVVAPAALTSLAHGIDRRSTGPVAIGVGMKHRFQTRLQIATDNFLGELGQQPLECPTGAYRHPPSEFPRVVPAEESSSLRTCDSRACRGCS